MCIGCIFLGVCFDALPGLLQQHALCTARTALTALHAACMALVGWASVARIG